MVFNEPDEAAMLRRFFGHVRQTKPHIFVSFNGDGFDWPFIETRAGILGMNLQQALLSLSHSFFLFFISITHTLAALCCVVCLLSVCMRVCVLFC
jgi:predicted PolB exonuclease-like 3'-5' exonuclease